MSQKVLFVCLGNICRSPLAEGLMLHYNQKHNLNWTIDSAGTASYHIGEAPDHRTIKNAAKNGIDLSPLRARQFSSSDFSEFDHIFVMDKSNYQNVVRLSEKEEDRKKVKLFLEYSLPDAIKEVPDPYYGGPEDFENVFQLVKKACEGLMIKLKIES